MPGPEGKSFPLCPFCYNSPPFEGVDTLFGAVKTGNSGKLGKGAGMPCFLCPHPTCRHSLIAQGVCACPECSGTLVLDPVSAPKWRLNCNMCNCLVFLPQGAHKIATTQERCPDCDSKIIEVDFNKKTTPLEDGATIYVGCILCDELLHSLVEMKHGKSFYKRMGSRGRGRGAGRGRGRSSGKRVDPKMSFRDFWTTYILLTSETASAVQLRNCLLFSLFEAKLTFGLCRECCRPWQGIMSCYVEWLSSGWDLVLTLEGIEFFYLFVILM